MFVKRVAKETLALNFAQALVVEKDIDSIGFIIKSGNSKDTKVVGKKTQASSIKTKEKDSFDMEPLAKSLKILTNEVSKLKRKLSNEHNNRKTSKLFIFRRNNNKQPSKSTQSSNFVFNVEILGMDNYCTFHHERHSHSGITT